MGQSGSVEEDHGAVGPSETGQCLEVEDAADAIFGNQGLSSKVQLSVSCSNLLNTDVGIGNLSDPMVLIYMQRSGTFSEIGRTECIANCLNPLFVSLISLEFHFEEVQTLSFKVYNIIASDVGKPSQFIQLESQSYLGECSCSLASIMGGAGQSLVMPLTNRGSADPTRGRLSVTGEEVANQNSIVRMRFRAERCDKKETIGLTSPFLKFHRLRETATGNTQIPTFKSEVQRQTLNPSWKMAEINVQTLCNGDLFRPMLIQCWHWKTSGAHELVGETTACLDDLMRRTTPEAMEERQNRLPLINHGIKNKKRNYVDSGELIFEECTLIKIPSFLDYIVGGTEIAFLVAIDFTASNGVATSPTSLHYIDPAGRRLNHYQHAIASVGQVLEFYDSDKQFPVWGFGGIQRRAESTVNHCFALNGSDENPEVAGIQGIMQAYNSAIQSVELSGPTNFSQVIQTTSTMAAATMDQPGSKYFVLLIITDGEITDMENTITSIIQAALLPMSILIVGVGGADFSKMNVLDGDEVRLHNATSTASRDIVQFVPMRDFVKADGSADPVVVAKQLLEEIPKQFLGFMKDRNIAPQQRRK